MNWKTHFEQRTINAKEAVKLIKSGDRITIGHAAGEPTALVNAMVQNKDAYENVEIVHMLSVGEGLYTKPGMEKHFRHNSTFLGAPDRAAVADGRADMTPVYFSKIPALFLDDILPVDVSMVNVSPPDASGFVSLGVSVDYDIAAIRKAKIVIAQVNRYCPRTHGESSVHVSEIDYFVPYDKPLIQLPQGQITDVDKAIATHCAAMVEDGSTLQLGIGSLPDAVLNCLKGKNDLGIHSEMISNGVMNLTKAGNINNLKKSIHRGQTVATFMMGTQELYDYVHDNPGFFMAPADYTNDPYVIAQNRKMISINSCVQIDLMGQVCSESVGLTQISGVGGQVDFIRGVNLTKDGISIMALPSTAKGGSLSKIVPILDPGAAVTTNRMDIHYVATEYGIVNLRGRTLRDRAKMLIGIAHPHFRPSLIEEFEKRFKETYKEEYFSAVG